MPASIAKYLLHLALSGSAYARQHGPADEARRAMSEYGLSEQQVSTLLSNDWQKITEALYEEISKTMPCDDVRATVLTDALAFYVHAGQGSGGNPPPPPPPPPPADEPEPEDASDPTELP